MGLHIIVCIKSVITKAPENGIVRSADTAALNPFDRPALEVAISMAEKQGGTVTAVSMGPPSCAFILNEAMAMGADRGILLSDPRLADSDTLATSTALAAAIKKLAPFDLVLFGTRTYDSDTGQVGPQTAVLLDAPLVTGVSGFEFIDTRLRVDRTIDGFGEEYELSLPAALTINPSAAAPRDLLLRGIEESFTGKEIEILALDDLGIDPRTVGNSGSPTRVLSLTRVTRERKCEFLTGTMDEQAEELVEFIKKSGLIG
ncbi:MAG TPA: electron transfer flavoprotein subunit beta/FixA family protein [Syntrophales bacterium]|nr:electron transfer flavoprotein subunit beta/FixA family protein [Syntrophales bacterium]HPQ42601.1 electron transfer flavoprotein subunit beta/FixA family protein [Syntrophales bacterium]